MAKSDSNSHDRKSLGEPSAKEFEGMLKATQTDMNVQKRDGRVVSFDEKLIAIAIQKAFCACQTLASSAELEEELLNRIEAMTAVIVDAVREKANSSEGVSVEHIQDLVEKVLMFPVRCVYRLQRCDACHHHMNPWVWYDVCK